MKRFFSYMMLAMVAMMMVGCQKDMEGVFTAMIEDYHAEDGKIYVGENRMAYWHRHDQVKINGVTGKLDLTTEPATIVGVSAIDGETYTAVYPAKSWVDATTVEYPRVQQYREAVTKGGNVAQVIDAPMVAKLTADLEANDGLNVLNFKNVGGLIKVKFKNPETAAEIEVMNIELEGNAGKMLWGKASYNYNSGQTTPTVTGITGGGNIVQLRFPEGKGMMAVNETKDFYIAVPATTGVTFRVKVYYKVAGINDVMVRKLWSTNNASGSKSIDRNKISTMNLATLGSGKYTVVEKSCFGTEFDPYLIGSKADLDMIDSKCNNGTTDGAYFKQTGDIVITDANWDGIGGVVDYVNHIGFKGIYDGDGHTVTIGTASTPCKGGLFEMISDGAEVRNVIVNARINYVNDITNNGCGAVVGFVENSIGVIIENCKAMGKIESGLTQTVVLGGICGKWQTKGYNNKIINCFNEVMLESTCSSGTDPESQLLILGGIIGSFNIKSSRELLYSGGIEISNCRNTAAITGMSNQGTYCGGIIGNLAADDASAEVEIDRCVNSGNVTGLIVGGLIGQAHGHMNLDITNSVNHGNIVGSYYSGGFVGGNQMKYLRNITPSNFLIKNGYSDGEFWEGTGQRGGIAGYVYCWGSDTMVYINNIYIDGDIARMEDLLNDQNLTWFMKTSADTEGCRGELPFFMTYGCYQPYTYSGWSCSHDYLIRSFFQENAISTLLSDLQSYAMPDKEPWVMRSNGMPGFAFEDVPWQMNR